MLPGRFRADIRRMYSRCKALGLVQGRFAFVVD